MQGDGVDNHLSQLMRANVGSRSIATSDAHLRRRQESLRLPPQLRIKVKWKYGVGVGSRAT